MRVGGRGRAYKTVSEQLLSADGGCMGIQSTLSSTFLYEICQKKKLEGEERTGRKDYGVSGCSGLP